MFELKCSCVTVAAVAAEASVRRGVQCRSVWRRGGGVGSGWGVKGEKRRDGGGPGWMKGR